MRIALAQVNTTVGDIRGNRERILEAMGKARRMSAELVLFPELSLTGYPPRDMLGIHGFVDANIAALRDIASISDRMGAVIGFVDRNTFGEGKEFHNAAALVAEGKILGVVHKTLLPTYDVFDEDRYFEKSQESRVISFRDRKIGISICEDAWNAEDFWPRPLYSTDPIKALVEGGADLLVNISASPFEMNKPTFRRTMLLEHVTRHRLPMLYLNLVGGNDDLIFDGNSLAIGSSGNLIAQAGGFQEDLLCVESDSSSNHAYREGDAIEDVLDALVLGTRDYAYKCGFRSAVLGLSGGIDSAVTACVAARALGAASVHGVSMPSVYSAQASHDDARMLARNLGIEFRVIPIQPLFQEYIGLLSPLFDGQPPDTTEENLQARIRGSILMALSNKFGHLVLSTGNKSELGVGYCTLYGDMAGGLAVISDVPKTVVYQLAAHINRECEVIPRNTLQRAPSAELRQDQTDQDSLPEYAVLDEVLRLRVEEQMSVDEIVSRGFCRNTVEEVVRMIHASEYKRRQAAPGLKVSPRAFGTGRRMPIASRLVF
jgi:NAD+ synthase (glutamine-hydrolysing)